ncbi:MULTISPECIES: hypothetical protein [Pseudomonas]|uniref:Pyrroloquinoline quinone biosynthesis protein PqqE n=2 Tax=Pseudomonas TaxID=286 RepID=A0ABS0MNC2_PSELU|nr:MULTISPECIES: hypothetical protein [Pseudomonas]MBH3438224.1 hypothetical protein [Pseudomonas luteola]MBW5412892.1 hypothetical protein [Pseudomonas sp. MAG002Y]SEQ84208.1 hypothetical protein SAMN05216409_10980 [Pseudomonas lutea]
MNISGNSFTYGVAAYQAGQFRVDQAGAAIAASSLPNDAQTRVDQVRSVDGASQNQADKAAQLVELQAGKREALAGSRVIQAASATLGSLIDTYA